MKNSISPSSNVPGPETPANLGRLPATGALIIFLPIKIEGGSGGRTG